MTSSLTEKVQHYFLKQYSAHTLRYFQAKKDV